MRAMDVPSRKIIPGKNRPPFTCAGRTESRCVVWRVWDTGKSCLEIHRICPLRCVKRPSRWRADNSANAMSKLAQQEVGDSSASLAKKNICETELLLLVRLTIDSKAQLLEAFEHNKFMVPHTRRSPNDSFAASVSLGKTQ